MVRTLGLSAPLRNVKSFLRMHKDVERAETTSIKLANHVWLEPVKDDSLPGGKVLSASPKGLASSLKFRSHPFMIADAINSWTREALGGGRGFLATIMEEDGLKTRPRILSTSVVSVSGE